MIAVDGSRLSHLAFQVAMGLRTKHEHILIYHVYDSQKTMQQQRQLLSAYYGHEHLELEFVSKCMASKCPSYHIVCADRSLSDRSTSQMILAFAEEHQVQTLVVGSFGRKGPSVWGTGSKTKASITTRKQV